MKSTLLACFTGICLIGTVYVMYRVYNLTSLLSQLSVQTSALNESILETRAHTKKNSEDINAVGKLIEEERASAANKIRVPEPWEEVLPLPETAARPKKAASGKATAKNSPSRESLSRQQQFADAGSYRGNGSSYAAGLNHSTRVAARENSEATPSFAVAGSSGAKSNTSMVVLKDRMSQLKNYAQKHGLDKEYALIADMGVNAGKKRFYIVNLTRMVVTRSGLMAYDKKSSDNSNTHIYRVEKTGREYYELYSLDNNGEIVSPEPEILSPVSCIPNEETGDFACGSDIGPGISPEFFGEIKQLINLRKNPVILWMFK